MRVKEWNGTNENLVPSVEVSLENWRNHENSTSFGSGGSSTLHDRRFRSNQRYVQRLRLGFGLWQYGGQFGHQCCDRQHEHGKANTSPPVKERICNAPGFDLGKRGPAAGLRPYLRAITGMEIGGVSSAYCPDLFCMARGPLGSRCDMASFCWVY